MYCVCILCRSGAWSRGEDESTEGEGEGCRGGGRLGGRKTPGKNALPICRTSKLLEVDAGVELADDEWGLGELEASLGRDSLLLLPLLLLLPGVDESTVRRRRPSLSGDAEGTLSVETENTFGDH